MIIKEREIEVQVENRHGGLSTEVANIDFPDRCPICSVAQDPTFIEAYIVPQNRLEAVFKCINKYCSRLFICVFAQFGGEAYFFSIAFPSKNVTVEFPQSIVDLSKDFSEIYTQSEKAENEGLSHIAGMGYRKALEHLIKDYLIELKKKDADKIKSKALGKCIKEDIENYKIKEMARKTSYIGNDEAHYERKHNDKDIKYLKRLLNLTVHWIAFEKETEEVLADGL